MGRQYFLLIDTETTQDDRVADFGAIVCTRKGEIVASAGVLVRGIFDRPERHPLFYTGDASPLWGRATLPARYARYQEMLENGSRVMASVPAVNRWIAKAVAKYRPILTAYNLSFDVKRCANTGIILEGMESFCLWQAACTKWAGRKDYKQFVLNSHAFKAPTDRGNMGYKTNAETMARYVTGNPLMPDEPHTALEDAIDYELPILRELLKSKRVTRNWLMTKPRPYNWKDYQVRDHFKAR